MDGFKYLLRKVLIMIVTMSISLQAFSAIEVYDFSDRELKQRFASLSEEFRCPKCQNQTLASSDALIAKDLRKLVKKLLEDELSDDEIRAYLVERYGDFVLYDPPFKPSTWFLWFSPFIAGILGMLVILILRTRANNQREDFTVNAKQLQNLISAATSGDKSND